MPPVVVTAGSCGALNSVGGSWGLEPKKQRGRGIALAALRIQGASREVFRCAKVRALAAAGSRGSSSAAGGREGRDMAPPLSALIPGGGRVLSIQSHTVQGYVGNKAAVFPLQLLGFDVDPINSVQFSNHTGYPSWRGEVLNGEQLWSLIEGLEANELLLYTHLLTGYIGSASFLDTILRVLERLRSINPHLVYVCDPVLGDKASFYVPRDLVPIFQSQVVPQASLLTPNQFEAEQLTGLRIQSENDIIEVCNALHKMGPKKVVITSANVNGDYLVVGSDASDASGQQQPVRFRVRITELPAYFTGTGDLMTALLLGWTHKYPGDLQKAVELSVSSLQAVLHRTLHDYELFKMPTTGTSLELRLIQSKNEILNPPSSCKSEQIIHLN